MQSVGKGSKRDDINKTGVGFKAVYHLTDVPLFMSNVSRHKKPEEIPDVFFVVSRIIFA